MSSAMVESMEVRTSGSRPADSPCACLPFGHLNLRSNPFGELQPRERAATAVVEIERFVDRLGRPGEAVQFMGDPGWGKTTHLLAVMARFPEAAYVHIPEDRKVPIPWGNPLFIDEIQRVPRRQRRRVFGRAIREGVPLALGTHLDVSGELVRAGFEVETVHVAERLDADRLSAMLNRRIEWARRDPGPLPEITIETARRLMARYGDNVRAVEGQLYEVFQELEEIGEV